MADSYSLFYSILREFFVEDYVPDLGSKYTAWSSVSTLIQKNLVMKTHNPARYSLTEEGLALGERLDDDDEEEKEEERIQPTERPTSSASQPRVLVPGMFFSGKPQNVPSRNPNSWSLLPGSYEIILCVDFIETTGGSKNCKQDLVKELQRNGVTFDVKGSSTWEISCGSLGKRLRLFQVSCGPPLAEEDDDLCGSIIDGRFREQKFRLKRCGLRNPCYLVEECGKAASHLSLPETTLQQAIINTQVIDRFFVKRVQDVRESMAYLTVMTRYLNKLYQNCTLTCRSRELEGDREEEERGTPPCSLISFAEFNHGAIKNKSQTVKEVFARQLMQVSGLSGDKAAAILELYSTPLSSKGTWVQL
ncbi:hypothetical protein JOQ06_005610 [Pogonophryne albipinna]|uniref:Crossover junction endonuclease MUS81 n=1 Tax=Pogonophryne albipinna TaxID=1090488 RepID=A0AAD6BJ79_9TELE|nr:hypothetical protein JOQ06_005610 [Pogonophryne albipinna]